MADQYQSQMKVEAMKKVYAEIILNTSKEAAVRVMVAERKALCFEKELRCLKQRSVHVLLRLKSHYHSQIQEAEARSLGQQAKIEVLEAQLGEAEGIIVDLRDELKEVQEKLDTVRHSQKAAPNRQIPVRDEHMHGHEPQDNAVNSSMASQVVDVKSILPDSTLDVASVHPTAPTFQSCHMMDSNNLSIKSNLGPFCSGDDVLSSIIMPNRETDLCRNGCTQRIRALEWNLSNVKMSALRADSDNSLVYIQSKTKEEVSHRREHPVTEKADEEPCSVSLSRTDEGNEKTTSNVLKRHLWRPRRCNKDQTLRSPRRTAATNARYREAIPSLKSKHRRKYVRSVEQPFPSPLKACLSSASVQSVKKTTIEVVKKEPKKTTSLSVDFSPNSEIMNSCSDVLGGELKNVVCAEKMDGLETRETLRINELVQSGLVNVLITEGCGSFHHQVVDESTLNFKFNRKRRKNALSKIDENIISDKKPVKRRLETPENNTPKDRMHTDSQGMLQVAQQLISLAGKGN